MLLLDASNGLNVALISPFCILISVSQLTDVVLTPANDYTALFLQT